MKEAAIGIILNEKKNEVLLIKRRDVPIWVLPGGGIEEGELPETACEREVYEETGIKVTCNKKIGVWLPVNRLTSPTHVFECGFTKIPNQLSPQIESEKVQFWPIDSLPKTLFFLHKKWLDQALKNSDTPIIAHLDDITYTKAALLLIKHPIFTLRYLLSRLGCPINR